MAELQRLLASKNGPRPEFLPEFFFTKKDIPQSPMMDTTDGTVDEDISSSQTPTLNSIDASCFPCMVSEVPPETSLNTINSQLEKLKNLEMNVGTKNLIDTVLNNVTKAHMDTCAYTKPKLEAALYAFKDKPLPPKMPTPNMMPQSNHMWDKFQSNMAPVIARVVSFCKQLPGFQELCKEDQMRLIKQGSFEVVLARFVPLVDHRTNSMYDPNIEVKIPRKMIQMLPLGKFLDEFFNYAEVMTPLRLSDGELSLLTTILLLCPERHGLVNKKAVYKLQGLYLQAMKQQVTKEHPDDNDRLQTILATIPILREINDRHAKQLNEMKMAPDEVDGAASLQMPELHNQVFDGQI